MHIVSYNILAQSYVQPDRYVGCAPKPLEARARLRLVVERVVGLQAAVVCLQEVEPTVFHALQAALPGHSGWYAPKHGRPDGLATFVRGFAVDHHRVVHFQHSDDGYDHIGQFMVLSGPGGTLRLGNTHLRWQRNDTPPARHQGVLQLAELLQALDTLPECHAPRVVCGDLNANAGSPVLRLARDRGLQRTAQGDRPQDTARINNRFRRLDWVLVDPALTGRERSLPNLHTVGAMPGRTEPSDHLPLQVDLSWR